MITVSLSLVLAAVYALTCVLLSLGVAVSWHAWVQYRRASARELLILRLAPAVGAAFLTLAVALPAFLMHEPDHESERAGPLLVALAVLAFAAACHCIVRGGRVWAATRALLRRCGRASGSHAGAGTTVKIVDLPEPFAAVVGAWRPQILAAACLRAACSDEEFRLVIAHEAAHGSSHDNRKLLVQILSPDALAWMPAGAALTERWRAAAELDADARASGGDPRKRLALASALLKVARLSMGMTRARSLALSLPVAADGVAERVRVLLAPMPAAAPIRLTPKRMAAVGLSIVVVSLPLYGLVQAAIELLVRFGR